MTKIRHGRQNMEAAGFIEAPMRGSREPAECCDKEGAARIARIIVDKWARLGYAVNVKLIQQEYIPTVRSTRWDIRSDMINGYPKDHPINAAQN